MIVTAHIKFGLHSAFLDSFFTAEDERLPGESIEDGVLRVRKQLEIAVDRLKKESESMRGQIISDALSEAADPYPPMDNWKIQTGQSPIINIQHEKIQIAIENAKTLEELKDIKTVHPLLPVPLMEMYNRKLKQLMK